MNSSLPIILFCMLIFPRLSAQNLGKEPEDDPVLDAIQQFKSQNSGKPNEVTVILDPPVESSSPKSEKKESGVPAHKNTDPPVLVTGTPPEGSELVADKADVASKKPDSTIEEPSPSANVAPPREGLTVHVEKLKSGSGSIDPAKVKLLAPFPAKPLASAPPGWLLQSSEKVPPVIREIELSAGKKITLSIRPHLLVPDSDGATIFSVLEPGFEPSLGYQQSTTVGAILSNSIIQLENDSKHMGVAIDKLQQLLASLPKSEPAAPPAVLEPPKLPSNRKR
jgi:hypothetical protein